MKFKTGQHLRQTRGVRRPGPAIRRDEGQRRVPVQPHQVATSQRVLPMTAQFFAEKLKRPELRNRLGDNIVVFDFIREASALAILQKQLDLVLQRFKEREQIDIIVEPSIHVSVGGVQTVSPSLFLPWPMAIFAPPGNLHTAHEVVPPGCG